MKTVSTEASECRDLEGGSGPVNTGVKHIGSNPLSLVPAVACAALGSCRPRQESEDSPRWRSTHMHSPCRRRLLSAFGGFGTEQGG